MKKLLPILALLPLLAASNPKDSSLVRNLFEREFNQGRSYSDLSYLCKQIGGRLSGSPQAEKAVQWAFAELKKDGFDSVWLQPVMVPHWVRGDKEKAYAKVGKKQIELSICALGNSVGTPEKGLEAEVLEVKTFEELRALPTEKVKGKIVFFSRPFPNNVLICGQAYGNTVNQRSQGPIEAAQKGAIGVLVRSMTHALDDEPHTGATNYRDSIPKIPGCAISTVDADELSKLIHENGCVRVWFRQTCKMLDDVLSYNVVAEMRGSENPNEIILVGGHLDSWDNGEGAHDDGAGCVQSMNALRLLKQEGYKPKRTLRAVLFMNEENGLKGGLKYAELAKANNEKHLAAIETDAGGFMPRHIGFTLPQDSLGKYKDWEKLLAPYGVQNFDANGGGADIGPLRNQGTVLIGYHPDGQKYFDIHHTAADTFEKVNKRELQFGTVVLSGMLYLLSEYGLR
ncbi:MAG: M20/M25/M40 family metallo-hydrolase [Bacteroidetes bacterium]|nr:M20/M25/M40 family metallo-hydrolase [Bacteroidota bacterium]